MSEATINNPNIRLSKINKILAPLTAAAVLGGIGLAFERGTSADSVFKSDIAVPTEAQPHINYSVRAGDTESSVAAHFGHANDLNYENMLNTQLPKTDQPDRMLRPGENLRIPEHP